MNTVYWVLVAFGIVVLEARLRARNVRYLPILPAIVLGAVLSKVTYVVLQWHYAFPHWGWGAFTVLRPDTFCFFGGAVGVVLGVIISAKLTHQKVLPVLDAFAPAGALLVAIARFGEKYLGEIGTAGFEMPEQLAFFPFALTNEWGESYPAIFMLSCLAALIVAIVGLTRKPGGRDGQLFLRTAFYLALPQIMCESLLAECMKWGLRAGAAAPVCADAAGNPDCGVPPCSGFIDLCEALVAGWRAAPVRGGAGRRGVRAG